MWTASDLIFSGQLQKRPRLKFMLAEGGIGWFPYIWERMDQVWQRHRYYQASSNSCARSAGWSAITAATASACGRSSSGLS